MSVIKSILSDQFHHDGRGPELLKIHLDGVHLKAIDFRSPDSGAQIGHLIFKGQQAFCITPEEEYDSRNQEFSWSEFGNAAIVNLGKSKWYSSFSNRHSQSCVHFQIMFYDEYLDIICEEIVVESGRYV